MFAVLHLLEQPLPLSKSAMESIDKATGQYFSQLIFTCDMALAWLMADSCERLPSGYVTERGYGGKRETLAF
ncbi:hypothetical protein [Aeromonas enteropelogenes]|uniref:hypothetical protein n=1 Tax=Aeromonas enteropelogenes TaxID=29489 RepID=UPI0039879990